EKIAQTVKQLSQDPVPNQQLPQHLENLQSARPHLMLELYSLDAEIQMRPALALGCFCFVLVGCPVGIWFSRSDYLSAFITCFLPNVFMYYPLYLCGTNLAKQGKVPLLAGIWAANALIALIGFGLFKRLMRN